MESTYSEEAVWQQRIDADRAGAASAARINAADIDQGVGEEMTKETFNVNFAALLQAYAYAQERVTPESQDVYWEMLKGIPDEQFKAGVKVCLGSCKFFPTIAELGEASLPAIEEPQPYNPFTYRPPRKIGWQEQVGRLQGRKEIAQNERRFLERFPLTKFDK